MSNRSLRIAIPAAQVLLLIMAVVWHTFAWHRLAQHGLAQYATTPGDILVKVNYPLVLLWYPIMYGLSMIISNPSLNMYGGATLTTISIVVFIAILASVAAFWYFVVCEFHFRMRGKSLIRFSSLGLEALKAIVLVAAGIGSIAYAYSDGRRLLLRALNNPHVLYSGNMIDATVGSLVLVLWSATLIIIAARDFAANVVHPSELDTRGHV